MDKRNMSSHPHTALFTLHSYMTPLSPPSLTPNDKRQKAENSCSNPQSLHLICTNAICLKASRGPQIAGRCIQKELQVGHSSRQGKARRSLEQELSPVQKLGARLGLKHSHVWKQTISRGHSRAATVLIGTLPIYRARRHKVFGFTLLGFSHALQTSHPVLMLNQGLI